MSMNYYIIPGIMDRYRKEVSPRPTTDKVLTTVAQYFNVESDLLKGPDRTRKNVYPRQIAMFFMKTICRESYKAIGRIFNRDHSTVIQSLHVISDLLDTEQQARYDKEQLKVLLFVESLDTPIAKSYHSGTQESA